MTSDYWVPLCNDFVSGKVASVLELYVRSVCLVESIAFILFLLVFEFVSNCYAELTTFGDRLFYQDFWNCTTYDEFGRKWNCIVHEFLYRHVYLVYTVDWGLTSTQGYILTTLISAVFHEYFLLCFLGFVRPYIIILMLAQVLMTFLFSGILRLKKVRTCVQNNLGINNGEPVLLALDRLRPGLPLPSVHCRFYGHE